MNTVLTPAGLPAYLAHMSNPSVPNHPTAPAPAFGSIHFLSLLGTASRWTLSLSRGTGKFSPMGHGLGFASNTQARRSAWPNRIYVVSGSSCHVVTDGLFTSGSSLPRVATMQ
jgi:hypothetical protein